MKSHYFSFQYIFLISLFKSNLNLHIKKYKKKTTFENYKFIIFLFYISKFKIKNDGKKKKAKSIFLGDSKVGKSSIFSRITQNTFNDYSITNIGSIYIPKIYINEEKKNTN